MSHRAPRYQSGVMGPHHSTRRGAQQNPQGRFPPATPNAFPGEIQRLRYLLEMERAGRYEDHQKLAYMEAELEETKVQLKRQKALKETFINKNKEAMRELERVEKFSDPATLNAAAIASKVDNDVKCKKKFLQQDYVELKVAHILSQESFTAEILAERKKSEILQEELDEVKTSYKEMHSRYEAEVSLLRQEAAEILVEKKTLQEELDEVNTSYKEMHSRYEAEVSLLRQEAAEILVEKKTLQEELDGVKTSFKDLHSRYETDISLLRQEAETQKIHEEKLSEQHRLLENMTAEKDDMIQKMSEKIAILQDQEKLVEEERKQSKHLYNDLICKYENQVSGLERDVETYRQKVNEEKVADLKTTENLQLIEKLRAEKEELSQKLLRELTVMQRMEKMLLSDLDQLHVSYDELQCRYNIDIVSLQQQLETSMEKLKKQETALKNEEMKQKLVNELHRRFSTKLHQQIDNLELQAIQQRNVYLQKSEEDEALMDSMRTTNAVLLDNTAKEIQFLQEKERETQAELETIKALYQELKSRYESEVTAGKQAGKQEIICVEEMKRTKEDLIPETLRAQKEDFQEEEENFEVHFNVFRSLSQEVSSEEELSAETFPGCSTDLKSAEETEIPAETILEELDNPETLQDGKKKKTKNSIWKRIRNFLRLKNSKKQQKREEHQDQA